MVYGMLFELCSRCDPQVRYRVEVKVNKNVKKKRGQYPAWLIKDFR